MSTSMNRSTFAMTEAPAPADAFTVSRNASLGVADAAF
jgi:hypothetical protein